MTVASKHCGTMAWLRVVLNMFDRTSASWSTQALSTRPGTLWGPAALRGSTLSGISSHWQGTWRAPGRPVGGAFQSSGPQTWHRRCWECSLEPLFYCSYFIVGFRELSWAGSRCVASHSQKLNTRHSTVKWYFYYRRTYSFQEHSPNILASNTFEKYILL